MIKDADTPYRSARAAMAGLLKVDLYREGIDGEAVEWARGRLEARDEQRRILVVISDGSPMDSATRLANDQDYLDHHLRDVLAAQSDVEYVRSAWDWTSASTTTIARHSTSPKERPAGWCPRCWRRSLRPARREGIPVTQAANRDGRVGHRRHEHRRGRGRVRGAAHRGRVHTGKPIPDDSSTGGRAPASGRRSQDCSAR